MSGSTSSGCRSSRRSDHRDGADVAPRQRKVRDPAPVRRREVLVTRHQLRSVVEPHASRIDRESVPGGFQQSLLACPGHRGLSTVLPRVEGDVPEAGEARAPGPLHVDADRTGRAHGGDDQAGRSAEAEMRDVSLDERPTVPAASTAGAPSTDLQPHTAQVPVHEVSEQLVRRIPLSGRPPPDPQAWSRVSQPGAPPGPTQSSPSPCRSPQRGQRDGPRAARAGGRR